MSIFKGFSKASEMCHILKNRSAICKSFRSIESAFSIKNENAPIPPKRPPTAYMLFCKDHRDAVLKREPSLKSTEVVKKLAVQWNNLSVEKREPYEITARQSILQYGEEHKRFFENLSEKEKEEFSKCKEDEKESRRFRKLKRALKADGLPKRPCSAYNFYVQSQSKVKENVNVEKLFKEISENWKKLPEQEKKSFEQQADLAKKSYATELEKWKRKMASEGKEDQIAEYNDLKEHIAKKRTKRRKEEISS